MEVDARWILYVGVGLAMAMMSNMALERLVVNELTNILRIIATLKYICTYCYI